MVDKFGIDQNETGSITDEIQLDIITFFTAFAKGSRYYNIDVLTSSEKQDDPLSDWKKIQGKIKQREGLVSQPLPKGYMDFVNSFTVFMQYDEEGNSIDSAEKFYEDSSTLDKLQGYSIFHIWKILQVLVDKLRSIEYAHNSLLTLSLREFFPYFIKDWDKHIDVLTWEDWNYLK